MNWITVNDIKNRTWTININCIATILWKEKGAVVYLTTLRGSLGFSDPGVGELNADTILLGAESAVSLSRQLVLPTEKASAFVKRNFEGVNAS